MNKKLNKSKSQVIFISKGMPTTLKHVQELRNILLTTTKPTKYLLTLKPTPKGTNLRRQIHTVHETRNHGTNSNDVLHEKSAFDFDVKPPVLEIINEQSEKSTSSIENENHDLKLVQSRTTICRLKGGWGWGNRETKQKESIEENETNSTNINDNHNTDQQVSSVVAEYNQIKAIQIDVPKASLDESSEQKFVWPNDVDSSANDHQEEQWMTKVKDSDENFKKANSDSNEFNEGHTKTSQISSISRNAPQETHPISEKPTSSVQCKDDVPMCRNISLSQTHCDLLDINREGPNNKSELFCISPTDEENGQKICNLEKQMETINRELNELKTEMLTPDVLAKLSFLSKRFNEVSTLLTELELNCLKLQKVELQAFEGDNSYQNDEIFTLDDTRNSSPTGCLSRPPMFTNAANNVYIPSFTLPNRTFNNYNELPLISSNVFEAIWEIIGNIRCDNIALTVFLETNNMYYINVSVIQTGQCLGCIYTNRAAFRKAEKKRLFENFLTFFVLNV